MHERYITSLDTSTAGEATPFHKPYALIMKGGGVKGLAYIGALKVLQEYYSFNWFVGTSAGAIAASFLAAGFTIDELEEVLSKKNFVEFLDSKRLWLLYNLITTGGLYPGKTITKWISNRINEKLLSTDPVKLNHDPAIHGTKLTHRLTIYASTTNKKALVFDSCAPASAEVEVAYAVRCSMSIPFLFAPQTFNGAITMDGGIQNNFPVETLLKDHPGTNFVGLYLGPEISIVEEKQSNPILAPLLDVLRSFFSIMLDAADKQALLVHRENTVVIDTQPIKTTDFALSDEEKDFLIKVGRLAALKYLIRKNHVKKPTEVEVKRAEEEVLEARSLAEKIRAKRKKRLQLKLLLLAFAVLAFITTSTVIAVRMLPRRSPSNEDQPAPLYEKQLTTLKGSEHTPSLSPDGNFVAFSWDRGEKFGSSIYVQTVTGGIPRQLTVGKKDHNPNWSPDGQYIAFVRNPGENGSVFVISSVGGSEERIAEINGTALAWFPDTGSSNDLIIADGRYRSQGYGLYSLNLKTRQKRLLRSLPTNRGIGCPDQVAFSWDGQYIAYISNCDLWSAPVLRVGPDIEIGTPFQITRESRELNGFTWLPNNREIIYSTKPGSTLALLRIEITPEAIPQVLPSIGQGATSPVISQGSHNSFVRLVFERALSSANITRLSLRDLRATIPLADETTDCSKTNKPCLISPSTQSDLNPKLSPDGEHIVFASTRSGSWEIYVCKSDGSEIRQLTRRGVFSGSPRWAPDGRHIAFDSTVDDDGILFKRNSYNREIFWMNIDGGEIHRLTSSSFEEARPSWSRDGKWIYFMSDRTGRYEIWKIEVATGCEMQVTHNGGFEAYESSDGKMLYYVKSHEDRGLWQMPVEGGPENLLCDFVREGLWDVASQGIYFIGSKSTDGPNSLNFLDVASRQIRELSKLRTDALEVPIGLSVSEQRGILLMIQPNPIHSDLFYVDGFR